jgi:hypothetical protein
MRYNRWLVVAALCSSVLLSGCFSYGHFNSPKVLEQDQGEIMVGMTGLVVSDAKYLMPAEVIIGARYGIGSNVDIGGRIFGIPFVYGGIMADIKYQLTTTLPYLATDFGVSYIGQNAGDSLHKLHMFAFYPSLIVGTERLYAAARAVIIAPIVKGSLVSDIDCNKSLIPCYRQLYGITTGYVIGSKFRVTPEVTVFWGQNSSPYVMPALGLSIR